MIRPSITARLYLGFLGLLILALGFLGTVSSLWFLRQESQNLDNFLVAEVQGVSNRLEGLVEGLRFRASDLRPQEVSEALRSELQSYLAQRLNRPIPYKTTLLILDPQGQVLAQSNRALDLSGPFPSLQPGEPRIEDVRDRGPAYRVITASYGLGDWGRGVFRIGCLLTGLEAPLGSFLASVVLLLGGSLGLLALLGAGLMTLTLRPVRTMSVAAGEISEHNLGARIPLPPGNDELARLARTLNALLARLETEFAFQERLVGELTHQLKTPLTILRGRNELALTAPQGPEGLREVIEDNLSDIDTVTNLLNTILELARLDSRIDRLKTVPVELGPLVDRLGSDLEPLWASKGLQFQAEGEPLTLSADPTALGQILTNLYDNAWKYAPEGSAVKTSWSVLPGGSEVRILVSNQGPPVAPDEREKIFKRFYRAVSGNEGIAGAGLGLAVVRSLVTLHGGTVQVVDPPGGGAGFELRLPYGSNR